MCEGVCEGMCVDSHSLTLRHSHSLTLRHSHSVTLTQSLTLTHSHSVHTIDLAHTDPQNKEFHILGSGYAAGLDKEKTENCTLFGISRNLMEMGAWI